ncbi:MAG: GntR family transcriptional regulator [Syntrophobacteraceae bacterium]
MEVQRSIKENLPSFFKIYQTLKQSILNGEFRKGANIGTLGSLAKVYGVAPDTVRRAISLLKKEGLLISRQGLGSIVPESANLAPMEMGKLIIERKVNPTFAAAKVHIYFADWVIPNYRFVQLYHLDERSPEPKVYRIFFRIDFSDDYNCAGLSALQTHFFSEEMLRELNVKKDTKPYDVLLRLSKWVDNKPLELTETMRPMFCVDENAKLLDLPDGTPVFYQEFIVKADMGPIHFWDHLSTANTLSSRTNLNQNGVYCSEADSDEK